MTRKQIAPILILGLLATLAAFGQTFTPGTAQGSLTATASSCATSGTACSILTVNAETSSVAWQVSGTFVGTVSFEGTVDGTNWVATAVVPVATVAGTRVLTTTAGGVWQLNAAGFSAVRARCSAYTSGTIVVYGRRSTGPVPFGATS